MVASCAPTVATEPPVVAPVAPPPSPASTPRDTEPPRAATLGAFVELAPSTDRVSYARAALEVAETDAFSMTFADLHLYDGATSRKGRQRYAVATQPACPVVGEHDPCAFVRVAARGQPFGALLPARAWTHISPGAKHAWAARRAPFGVDAIDATGAAREVTTDADVELDEARVVEHADGLLVVGTSLVEAAAHGVRDGSERRAPMLATLPLATDGTHGKKLRTLPITAPSETWATAAFARFWAGDGKRIAVSWAAAATSGDAAHPTARVLIATREALAPPKLGSRSSGKAKHSCAAPTRSLHDPTIAKTFHLISLDARGAIVGDQAGKVVEGELAKTAVGARLLAELDGNATGASDAFSGPAPRSIVAASFDRDAREGMVVVSGSSGQVARTFDENGQPTGTPRSCEIASGSHLGHLGDDWVATQGGNAVFVTGPRAGAVPLAPEPTDRQWWSPLEPVRGRILGVRVRGEPRVLEVYDATTGVPLASAAAPPDFSHARLAVLPDGIGVVGRGATPFSFVAAGTELRPVPVGDSGDWVLGWDGAWLVEIDRLTPPGRPRAPHEAAASPAWLRASEAPVAFGSLLAATGEMIPLAGLAPPNGVCEHALPTGPRRFVLVCRESLSATSPGVGVGLRVVR